MQQVDTLVFIIGCIAVVGVLYGPWQEFWIEWARQRMFDARDVLFDRAADGVFSFKDKNYKEFREEIEGYIRFAHKITLTRLLVYRLTLKSHFHKNTRVSVLRNVEEGPQKQAMLDASKRVVSTMLAMMVMRNPLLWFPVTVLALFVLAAHQQRRAKKYAYSMGKAVMEYVRDAARAESAIPHLHILSMVRQT